MKHQVRAVLAKKNRNADNEPGVSVTEKENKGADETLTTSGANKRKRQEDDEPVVDAPAKRKKHDSLIHDGFLCHKNGEYKDSEYFECAE